MAKNGLVHITTTSFSGQSSISIDNCFSSSYTHYLIKRNLLGSTQTSRIDMRLRASSSDSTTNYAYQNLDVSSTSATGSRATSQNAFLGALGNNEVSEFGFAECWISNPFESIRTTVWTDQGYSQTGNISMSIWLQSHATNSSYTGVTIFPNTGTFSGSISVWGLVKS